MRLIDADIENERLLDFIAQHDTGIQYALEHKDMTILEDIFFEYFNEQAVFDLESVIKKLEQKRDYYYKEMKNTDGCCVGMFNEYHSKGIAFNEALEILKSAANATNGKNGG